MGGGPATTSSECRDKGSETGPVASPVVVMQSAGGGIEILAEDRTYALGPEEARHLLFYGNRVRLSGGDAVARPGADRRWICFILDGGAHVIGRSRLVAVLRGSVPADCLARLEVP